MMMMTEFVLLQVGTGPHVVSDAVSHHHELKACIYCAHNMICIAERVPLGQQRPPNHNTVMMYV